MIISFKHKFIFVAIPKTATHSIRNALRPNLAEQDWEQCVRFEKKYFPVEALANIGHGHITCMQVRPFVLPDTWDEYFKFCVVRNPFDRFESYCRFINRNNQKMKDDPLGTMKAAIENRATREHVLCRPQFEFVTDEEERLVVDFVAKLETLQGDFDRICGELGFPHVELERINASRPEEQSASFDSELGGMIREYFRKDFELFDYPKAEGGSVACS